MNQRKSANNNPRASPSEAPYATVFFVGGKSGNGRNDRDGDDSKNGRVSTSKKSAVPKSNERSSINCQIQLS